MQNRLLLVLEYLWKYTDETHVVTIKELESYLAGKGIHANRKTLTQDLRTLEDFGLDVVCNRSVQNRYFLATRVFDYTEVRLLIDAVQSSRFITPRKSQALVKKLSSFVSEAQQLDVDQQLYVDGAVKAANESIYRCVDVIQTAIAEKKKIRFRYFEYDENKTKQLRYDGEPYLVSPYLLVWNNDRYYVVGYYERRGFVTRFRLDKMLDPEVLDEAQIITEKAYDPGEFFSREFSMVDGDKCTVELLCENDLMDSVIDHFGKDVLTRIADDAHFIVTTEVELSNMFYAWVFASCGSMRILSPKKVKEEMLSFCKAFMASAGYEEDTEEIKRQHATNMFHDMVAFFLESVDDAKAKAGSDKFEAGRLFAYYDVLLTIQEECDADSIDLSQIGLDINLEKRCL